MDRVNISVYHSSTQVCSSVCYVFSITVIYSYSSLLTVPCIRWTICCEILVQLHKKYYVEVKGHFCPFEDKTGIGQTNTACKSQVRGKLHDFEEMSARRIVRPVTCYIYMADFYISNTVMCMLYWNIQIMYPWKGLF